MQSFQIPYFISIKVWDEIIRKLEFQAQILCEKSKEKGELSEYPTAVLSKTTRFSF